MKALSSCLQLLSTKISTMILSANAYPADFDYLVPNN
jgi:hypothetical protein